MNYIIRTNIIEKICYYRGILLEDTAEIIFLERLLFTNEEIKLGYRIIELDYDIEIYISQEIESVIDKNLTKFIRDFPNHKQIFIPPRRFLEDPYVDFYQIQNK